MKTHPGLRDISLLAALSLAALLVHGYHPYVEDAGIYVPAVKQILHPGLYPYNAQFFASHAHMTLYPQLIAASVRLTHLPLDWAFLLWHAGCIFLLLLACWHLGGLVFDGPLARWGGVALVAALLTLPVAGTALYIMDEYVNPRSLSTPAVLFLIIDCAERKYWRALAWGLFTAAIHPLMAVFGVSYSLVLLWMEHRESLAARRSPAMIAGSLLFPFGLFPHPSEAYREAFRKKPYFFLLRWQWYEWLGVIAPLALLTWFAAIARRRKLAEMDRMCRALVIYGGVFLLLGLVLTGSPRFLNLVELQPLRAFHLLYVMFLVFAGGLLAQSVLERHVWRWALVFVPLCGAMWYSQCQLFPATPHLEWPGAQPRNDWVEAFLWIRHNTPLDAYFALDPEHMALPGEDQHGFRAIAERSMLADDVKDRGAVTMFPAIAETWLAQVKAQRGFASFQLADFRRLQSTYGVDWVVVERPAAAGLSCPYQNLSLAVCQIQ